MIWKNWQYDLHDLPLDDPIPFPANERAHFLVAAKTALNLFILVLGIPSPNRLNTLLSYKYRGAILRWIKYVKLIVFSAITPQDDSFIVKT